jgi:hypothetical protein
MFFSYRENPSMDFRCSELLALFAPQKTVPVRNSMPLKNISPNL